MIYFSFFAFIGVSTLFFVYHSLTKKYLNPYKLIFIFGKKGSGKSTLLTKYALDYSRRGWNVYSTEKCPGTFRISPEDVGRFQFPPRSVIIVDEVGMIWDNRDFKNFSTQVRDYFKLQRHYKHVVILASQTFDVDKKIRDLADEMYLVTKKFRVFSYAKKILRQTVLVEATGQSPSKIDENLVFDSLFLFWAGSRKFTFIPKYTKYFDSFKVPDLKEKEFEKVPELNIPVKRVKLFKNPFRGRKWLRRFLSRIRSTK
jgi:DNA helicase HerA-like ATPase